MSDDTYHHTVFPGLIHAADDASSRVPRDRRRRRVRNDIAASLAAMRASVVAEVGRLARRRGRSPRAGLDHLLFLRRRSPLWILIVSGLLFARGARDSSGQTGAVPR